MTPEPLPPLNLVLTLLRLAANWNQAELARAAGVRPTMISDYERGHKKLTRARLEELVGYLGFTEQSIDLTLRFVETIRRATRAPGTPDEPDEPDAGDRRRIDAIAAEAGRLASGFVFSVLDAVTIQGSTLDGATSLAQSSSRAVSLRMPRGHTRSTSTRDPSCDSGAS